MRLKKKGWDGMSEMAKSLLIRGSEQRHWTSYQIWMDCPALFRRVRVPYEMTRDRRIGGL